MEIRTISAGGYNLWASAVGGETVIIASLPDIDSNEIGIKRVVTEEIEINMSVEELKPKMKAF